MIKIKGWRQARLLLPLLMLLMLGMIASGAIAQEDEGQSDDGSTTLTFLDNGDSALPENVTAAAGEVWIPVTKDAYMASNDPNRNFGFDELIRFGYSPNGLGATRPIFKFKVEESIPSDANISKAEMHVYLTSVRDSDTSRGYAAHDVNVAWDEGTVTWNNMPSYGAEIGRGTLGNSPGWQVVEITGQVRQWLKNPGNNKGVILVGDERPDQNFERDYFSKQTTSGLYPRLYVKFDVSTDDTPPVANVIIPSPGAWSPADFIVGWEGNDPPNSDGSPGSGIRWYDVYYSTNQGASWIIGRAQVTNTQTNVTAAPHLRRIDFYARAMDNAGNEGPVPTNSSFTQSWTRIDAEPPAATVNPLPEASPAFFTVSWQDTKELSESGIRYYDVQYRVQGGQWLQLVYDTTATSTQFSQGQNGVTYEFRARGVDNVGNVQPWSGPQATTTVYTEPIVNIQIPFSPPIYPQPGMAPDGFTVQWVGIAPPNQSIASFDVQYQRPGNPTWLSFANNVTQTSKFFQLQPSDPDGWYVFRARATTTNGQTTLWPTNEDLYGRVLVNREGKFVPLWLPIVADEAQ